MIPAWGAGGRGFKSHPPHHKATHVFLSYGIWRLKQGRAEETVKENIRKLRRLANHVNLENTDVVKCISALK